MQTPLMIELVPLSDTFHIYKMEEGQEIPPQMLSAGFFSVTSTPEEVSVITNCPKNFPMFISDKGWKGFKVEGILDLSLVGILYDIIQPLKDNSISVFVTSTFNTDYIFVKEDQFEKATEIFKLADNLNLKTD
ncbi:MAG TPA: ACT domain-containing protein [Prolixibacteraceae bacterium]|nr:ACT domain-containing protein [Prolixibacteraceae bacterium]